MASKNKKNKLTVTSRAKYFWPSSNKTSPSPSYHVVSKIKAAPKEKYNDELTADIGDSSYYSPFVIDDDLKMGDMSGGIFISITTKFISTVLWYQ